MILEANPSFKDAASTLRIKIAYNFCPLSSNLVINTLGTTRDVVTH